MLKTSHAGLARPNLPLKDQVCDLYVEIKSDSSTTAVRRGHIGIAVTAAASAPFILVQSTWPETASEAGPPVPTPLVFPILTIVVAVLLAALAAVSAIAARRNRVSMPGAALLFGVPMLAFGGLGVVSGQNVRLTEFGQFATVGIMLALPFAVWVLAFMWWDRVRHPLKAGLMWGAIALAGLPATLVVVLVGFMLSMLVATPLLELQGHGYPADGAALLPGVILTAIGAGIGAALLMARPPRPVPNPQPASGTAPSSTTWSMSPG